MIKNFSLVNSLRKSSVVNLRNALVLAACFLFLAPQQSQAQVLPEIEEINMRHGVRNQSGTRLSTSTAPKKQGTSTSAFAISNDTYVGNSELRKVRKQPSSAYFVSSSPFSRFDLTSFYYMMIQWIGVRP